MSLFLFSDYFRTITVSFYLCTESTSYVFSFRMMFFYLVATGWIFDISLFCDISINQSKMYIQMWSYVHIYLCIYLEFKLVSFFRGRRY